MVDLRELRSWVKQHRQSPDTEEVQSDQNVLII